MNIQVAQPRPAPADAPTPPPGAAMPQVRVPLSAKITLPYLILAVAVALAAAYVVTNIIFDSVEERFSNQLIEAGKIASEAMVREENRLLATLRLLAYTSGMAEAVQAGDAEAVRQLAFPIALNGLEEAVEILDAQGRLVLALRHNPGGALEDYAFSQQGGEVLRAAPLVQAVLAGQLDAQGDKFAAAIEAPWGAYFYVGGPLYDSQGRLAGVILVGKSAAQLARQMREATLAQVTLYRADGSALASSFIEPRSLAAEAAAGALGGQDQASPQRSLTVANIDYAEIFGPWEVRGGADLGLLGAALPHTFLVRASAATRGQVLSVVAAALVLIVVIGWYVARRITVPLLGVVRASVAVADGDLQVKVDENSSDEIALLARSFNHMVANLQRSRQDLLQAYDNTLAGWSRALDLRDRETEGHTQRVTQMAVELAAAMGLPEADLVQLRRGALLHDIGKMGVPDSILLKPGPLTREEWITMREHPAYARDMLMPIEFLRPALDIPYYHHERWDGSGYPCGLAGEAIPLAARIFAVVDVWDALCSHRPYREAWPENQVLDYLQAQAGIHFDPAVVEAFVRLRRPRLA